MATYTEYMNKSLELRKQIEIKTQRDIENKVNYLGLLNKIDKRAEKKPCIRNRFIDWMDGKASTLKLREICKEVGYDYWSSLKNSNIIDAFDSRFN